MHATCGDDVTLFMLLEFAQTGALYVYRPDKTFINNGGQHAREGGKESRKREGV